VRHLLTHTSGIRSFTEQPVILADLGKQSTPAGVLHLVRRRPLAFRPGTVWSYNNTGYFVLGMLVKRLFGKSYADLLRDRLFTPAGMTRTRVAHPRSLLKWCAALRAGKFVRLETLRRM
jgi:CubicO group peptidase (beta-lactamase class C family)